MLSTGFSLKDKDDDTLVLCLVNFLSLLPLCLSFSELVAIVLDCLDLPAVAAERLANPDLFRFIGSRRLRFVLVVLVAVVFYFTPVLLHIVCLVEGVACHNFRLLASESVIKQFLHFARGLLWAQLIVDAGDDQRVICDEIIDEGVG